VLRLFEMTGSRGSFEARSLEGAAVPAIPA
jgi:hypothetical protein